MAVQMGVATASDVFICQELTAAVVDAERGFASRKGALNLQGQKIPAGRKCLHRCGHEPGQAQDANAASRLHLPFAGVCKLDKALRAQLNAHVSEASSFDAAGALAQSAQTMATERLAKIEPRHAQLKT